MAHKVIKNKNIFLTGGAGFIGSTLIERLIDDNKVTVYDSFRRDSLSSKPYCSHPNLRIVKGDVLDYAALKSAMDGANYVVHCAAIAGIDTVIKRPTETMRVNMIGTANALEAARELPNLERFVDFSTSEVFGQSAFRAEENHVTHIGAVGEARWTYAVSKLAGEHLAKAYHDEYWMPTVTLRPFNIYGPGQVGEGAIKIFVEKALRGDDILIHGDGNQIRAWCFIDDFVEGLLLTLTHPKAVGESFNLGNARAVLTIYGLAQTIVRVLNSRTRIVFTRKDYADVELRVPSVAKARELIGFEAKVDLEEGLVRTAEYFKKLMNDADTSSAGKTSV
jgi:UDP-glucose 4-epimerase